MGAEVGLASSDPQEYFAGGGGREGDGYLRIIRRVERRKKIIER